MKKYIAFFDLDHTILDSSSGRLFIKYSYRHGLLSLPEIGYGLFVSIMHRMGLIDTAKVISKLSMKFRGWTVEQIQELNRDFFDEFVKSRIRESIVSEIEHHRRNGGLTVILSASTWYICRLVQLHLHMDDVLCTIPEVNNGILTGRLSGNYCYGKEKLERALKFCIERGLEMQSSWYYADSIADLPVLERVGNPVCVAPDSRLRKAAEVRKWRIINPPR